ncbi:hypothetical protein J2S74_000044 [Evansella vedderi]|uniref:ABC transporter permease n=1 Tax=Evansella vedderi TaxID=38282 RepID=A0ABT9ZPN6_9BACI|nr:hypothetical protein [Evansella vedderi]MDQ0252672.1 hypothetical protein [Evansella vedderi]
MNAWLSLTKKELRLGTTPFIIPIIAFFLLVALVAYIGSRFDFASEAVAILSFTVIGIQVFYLAYYLLFSLGAEKRKMHLWLHNPISGSALLLAKVAAALISMALTFMITAVTLAVAIGMAENIPFEISWSTMAQVGMLGGLHLFLVAISFAAWFLFLWMVFLLLNRTFGTFISFVFTFIFFITATGAYGWFTESAIYDALTMWGAINIEVFVTEVFMSMDLPVGEFTAQAGPLTIYFGQYFFEAVVTLILFFAAAWMLDRKVEV